MQISEHPKKVTVVLLLALATLPVQPMVMGQGLAHHPVSPLESRRETAGSDHHWVCVPLLPQSRARLAVLVAAAPIQPIYRTRV